MTEDFTTLYLAELKGMNATQRAIAATTYADMEAIRARAIVDSDTECHVYQGATDRDGYGQRWQHGMTVKVHRVVADWHFGPIEGDWQVHHFCHRPACISPLHLGLVTPRDHQRIEHLHRMAQRRRS
jgi:hypothetical protein